MPTLRIKTDGSPELIYKTELDLTAQAVSDAIKAAADTVKADARADIASAGFGKKWQNALRVNVYPPNRPSLGAAVYIYHNIYYSGIFETGGAISGKPTLWVPLDWTPKQIGRRKVTPRRLISSGLGPLFPIKKGGNTFLAAPVAVTKKQARTGAVVKPTLAKIRKAQQGGVPTRAVPLFVAKSQVTLRDRFSITEICEAAADRIPGEFASRLSSQG